MGDTMVWFTYGVKPWFKLVKVWCCIQTHPSTLTTVSYDFVSKNKPWFVAGCWFTHLNYGLAFHTNPVSSFVKVYV